MEQLWNIDLQLNIHVIKWHRNPRHRRSNKGQIPYFLSSRMPAFSSKFHKFLSLLQDIKRFIVLYPDFEDSYSLLLLSVFVIVSYAFLDGKVLEIFNVFKTQLKSVI